jgi:hypothetical protein
MYKYHFSLDIGVCFSFVVLVVLFLFNTAVFFSPSNHFLCLDGVVIKFIAAQKKNVGNVFALLF